MTITLQNISRQFSQKKALDAISTEFAGSKIHALVGENGAGKSTLASILCGDREASSGTLFLDGTPAVFKNPRQAADRGIILVHQRPLLAESISVQENILLGLEHCPVSYGSFSAKPLTKKEALERLSAYKKQWAPELKLKTLVQNIGGDDRFYTSLLGALCRNPLVLILDEPSSFLNEAQRQHLYKNLRLLAEKGTAIIVITHSMAEARQYCDTVTSLAKGRITARYEHSADFKEGCAGYIDFNTHGSTENARILSNPKDNPMKNYISFSDVTVRPVNRPALFNVSFTVKSGCITLIQGLSESGLGTLEDLVTGMILFRSSGKVMLCCTSGTAEKTEITIDLSKKILTAAMLRGKNKNIAAIIPSDRTFRAANPDLNVGQILCVYYTGKNPASYAKKLIREADVAIKPEEKGEKLSGGMLQRLILARELDVNPAFLILCEPLQGLDSQAAEDMKSKLSLLAAQGKAVLILSASGFPEQFCQTVYTLSGGILTLQSDKTEAV